MTSTTENSVTNGAGTVGGQAEKHLGMFYY